jgi:hypothetical protein
LIVAFGGADRELCHFQDLIVYRSLSSVKSSSVGSSSLFESLKSSSGDIPTPRSGHSLVAYGKYVLLFGGIDFSEEVCYNDLYLLDSGLFCCNCRLSLSSFPLFFTIEIWEWSYVGESGAEVTARNSHSMTILEDFFEEEKRQILVIYGGASPDKGTLNDTVFALLPKDPSTIVPNSFFVEWQILESSDYPPSREMHSFARSPDRSMMIITGGRNEENPLLNDVWCLSVTSTSEGTNHHTSSFPSSSFSSSLSVSSPVLLKWQKVQGGSLPCGLCSHSSSVVMRRRATNNNNSTKDIILPFDEFYLMIVGGLNEKGVSSDLHYAKLHFSDELSSSSSSSYHELVSLSNWNRFSLNSTVGCRFGQSLCPVSLSFLSHLFSNERYRPILSSKSLSFTSKFEQYEKDKEEWSSVCCGSLLFGGVNIENDFADLWLILF